MCATRLLAHPVTFMQTILIGVFFTSLLFVFDKVGQKMSYSFLFANHISAAFCICLGWPANLLLIWLIRNRTMQAMQVWSRVLLQAALIDLLLILVTFIVQPVLINDGNMLFGFLIGPFAKSNLFTAFILLYFYIFCSEFAKYAMAVQFVYRWLVICRDRKLSLWHYTLLLIAPATMALVLFMFMVVNWLHNNIPNTICYKCPADHTIALATLLENTGTKLANFLVLSFTATTYAVIAVTSLHIWLRSRHTLMAQQQQSREIRRQVGYVLLVQAALPLAFSLVPNVLKYFKILLGLQQMEWLSLFYYQCWPSMLYPMATILIVGQYRKWLFELFQGIFGGGNSAVAINPSNQQTTAVATLQRITVRSGINRGGQIRVQ